MQNITIVGLGAIGTVYAVALQDAGVNLRVALDVSRVERYRSDALYFNDRRYDFDYYTPSATDKVADLVIIATKSGALSSALDLIAPIVGDNTQILPLLNGITSEQICAERFGWHRVVYGYFIGHTSTRYQNRVSQDGQYRTYFGEVRNTEISPRVAAICALFDTANIPYKVPEDMMGSLWQKYIINIGMNQATAVLRCTYGHLQRSEAAREYMIVLMNEAAAVATARGIKGSDKMVAKALSMLMTLSPEDGSSMYQDVMGSRATEVDFFAETVCQMGAELGIPTPANHSVSLILRALEPVKPLRQ